MADNMLASFNMCLLLGYEVLICKNAEKLSLDTFILKSFWQLYNQQWVYIVFVLMLISVCIKYNTGTLSVVIITKEI